MAGTRYVGFAEEVTYGTKISTDNQFTYDDAASAELDVPDEPALVYEGISQAVPQVIAKGQYAPEGDVQVPLDGIISGWFIKWLLGEYRRCQQTDGGAEVYTHTFRGANALNSFTTRIGKEVFQHTFQGCKIASGSIEIPKGEFATMSMSLAAKQDSKDTILAESAVVISREAFFTFAHATVSIGSTIDCESLTLDINNNISAEDGVLLGSRFPQSLPEGGKEIEISAEIPFESDDQYEQFWGSTSGPDDIDTVAVTITLTSETEIVTSGGQYYTITFTFPRCYFKSAKAPVSGRDRMVQSVTLGVLYDAVTGYYVEATIKNGAHNYSLDANFRSVDAVSATNAFAAGTKGKCWMTTDGAAWTSQTTGYTAHADKINCVRMFDASNGWAVGDDGVVLLTTNAGTTWTAKPITGVTANLYGVAAISATTCWVVGAGGIIYTTADSGATWTAKTSGTTADLYAITKSTATFVAVGAGGKILTSAAGTTWATATSGVTKDLLGVDNFVNVTELIMAVGEDGCVLTSTDAAAWTDKSIAAIPSTDLRGVSLVSLTVANVCGDNCAVYATANAGTAWTAKTTGQSNKDYYDISCYSAAVWYVCGTFESVCKTTDSGATFTVQTI
jgi:photosystem II stability/assembly factor-like uncharacterized protein